MFDGLTVLVTGASAGIGSAFARHAAKEGADVVLVARRRDRLDELAKELETDHGIDAHVIVADLSAPDAAARLVDDLTTRSIDVDVLINNAGFATHGDVVTSDPEVLDREVALNVATLVGLTSRLTPSMVERRRGAVINVASTAAFQPVPHMAVYAATKAFVLSFTRALWKECQGTGVSAIAICPGATDTEFFDVVGDDASVGGRRSVEQVVATTMRGLRRNRPSIVDGLANRVTAAAAPRMPSRLALTIAERSVRPTA